MVSSDLPGLEAGVWWMQLLADADTLVLIGVRANEEDGHIWEAVRGSAATGLYKDEFEKWRAVLRQPTHIGGGSERFEVAFESLQYTLTTT